MTFAPIASIPRAYLDSRPVRIRHGSGQVRTARWWPSDGRKAGGCWVCVETGHELLGVESYAIDRPGDQQDTKRR